MLSVGTPHDPWEQSNVPEQFYDLFRDTPFPVPPNYSDAMDPYGDACWIVDRVIRQSATLSDSVLGRRQTV